MCPVCAPNIDEWRERANKTWWRQRISGTRPALGWVSAMIFFVGLRYALGGGPAGDEGPSRVVGFVAMAFAVVIFFVVK